MIVPVQISFCIYFSFFFRYNQISLANCNKDVQKFQMKRKKCVTNSTGMHNSDVEKLIVFNLPFVLLSFQEIDDYDDFMTCAVAWHMLEDIWSRDDFLFEDILYADYLFSIIHAIEDSTLSQHFPSELRTKKRLVSEHAQSTLLEFASGKNTNGKTWEQGHIGLLKDQFEKISKRYETTYADLNVKELIRNFTQKLNSKSKRSVSKKRTFRGNGTKVQRRRRRRMKERKKLRRGESC